MLFRVVDAEIGSKRALAGIAVPDKIRNAQLALGERFDVAWRSAGKPLRMALSLRSLAPERLLISPQDIRTADPTVAADIYAGYFAFAGKMVNTHGRSVFELTPPSPAWAAPLVSFVWLRHLRAADTALARANARALVEDFLTLASANPVLPIWEPKVAARRLLSWLSQSPMILEDADRAFYRRFMKALGRHAIKLQNALSDGLRGEARLLVVIALAELGLCAAGVGNLPRRSTRLLADELARQIFPDGGHIGRNPQMLIELLLDLLPLRQAYTARGLAAPQELLNAIDRMLPMLRLFRHGDGSLALFNGMGVTPPHMIATVLAYDDARAVALANAPYSGYQRLEASGAVLVMDTGAPPPSQFSERAHAGQLSFEFSSDGQNIVGNCGAPDEMRAAARLAARSTAAHSTIVVADTSSSRFAPESGIGRWLKGRIISGPKQVPVSRDHNETGPGLSASHDGYLVEFGLVHERALRLSADGTQLIGRDNLSAHGDKVADAPYAVRFHLHPTVRAICADDGLSVGLVLPDGAQWLFHADGMPVQIEPSVYFAVPEGMRGAEQIVVHASLSQATGINWVFERTQAAPV